MIHIKKVLIGFLLCICSPSILSQKTKNPEDQGPESLKREFHHNIKIEMDDKTTHVLEKALEQPGSLGALLDLVYLKNEWEKKRLENLKIIFSWPTVAVILGSGYLILAYRSGCL